jgi:hypothetical protein
MIEKLFKSFAIKITLGAIIFFVVGFGVFLLAGKQPQILISDTGIPEARKIPKLKSTVEPSVKQRFQPSEKISSSEIVLETTMDRNISEPGEALLNSENPSESGKEDTTDSVAGEEIVKEGEIADSISAEDTPEEGKTADSISDEETLEENEMAKSVYVNETDAFSGMKAGGEIEGEERVEEEVSAISQEQEIEKSVVKEQSESETPATEKKPSLSEHGEKKIIQDIILSESGSENKLIVRTNSPVTNYKYFILSNPPRLVVDLPGEWKDPDFIERKPDNSLISRIRLWNHGDKLRIVNDLKSDKALFPVFTKSSDGVEAVLRTGSNF